VTWEFTCTLNRVVDGDTWWFDVDLGFHTTMKVEFRAIGIDCPEKGTDMGEQAKRFAQDWMNLHKGDLAIESHKTEKWGRWEGDVYALSTGEHLIARLLGAGLALPWDGRGPSPWVSTTAPGT
jgi:endonuclease YncB( thermonuclease family)